MTRCDGLVAAHVLFLKPGDMPAGWELTDLWHRAAAIPGVRVLAHEQGREARLFVATTSGHAALYDPDGRLTFHGGITIARGHVGDNDGRHAIIGRLNGVVDGPCDRAVHGCPLFTGRSATATSNAAITRTDDRLVPEDSARCDERPAQGPAPDPDGGGSP